jgi:hypothetical protein
VCVCVRGRARPTEGYGTLLTDQYCIRTVVLNLRPMHPLHCEIPVAWHLLSFGQIKHLIRCPVFYSQSVSPVSKLAYFNYFLRWVREQPAVLRTETSTPDRNVTPCHALTQTVSLTTTVSCISCERRVDQTYRLSGRKLQRWTSGRSSPCH